MTYRERLDALVDFGKILTPKNENLETVVRKTASHNAWFTEANQWKAIAEIRAAFLQKDTLETWIVPYYPKNKIQNNSSNTFNTEGLPPKTVALILAGNIPLVGFHDIISVFLTGHKSLIKTSDKDPFFIPFMIAQLAQLNVPVDQYFIVSKGHLKDFDAVIATGSNNSARYFDAYFGKYPNIIRKNRNALGILRGDETSEDLAQLGEDIFTYFGLGCRNVSKIYVPKNYNFNPLLEALHEFNQLVLHDKYKNNFDYQFTLTILNNVKHHANGCIILTENTAITSPISTLFYEYYDSFEQLSMDLLARKEEIQCVVSKNKIEGLPCFDFGEAQKPSLNDYADGEDTIQFLLGL
jgi:Acyl-CoA reductase (LuxC)